MTENSRPTPRRFRIRWGRLATVVFVAALLTAGIAAAGVGGLYSYYASAIYKPTRGGAVGAAAQVRSDERLNILVMGVDAEGGRTDTMILAAFDSSAGKAAIVSIPRDTRAEIAGLGRVEKIAHAHAYTHDDMDGAERAKRTVSSLLGVPVHHYVTIDLSGFVQIVDRLGGVDFEVPFDMNYDDPYQNFHIHLRKGFQHLDGRKALQLVRYRSDNPDKDGVIRRGYPDGDVGRVQTQQKFMRALLDRVFSVGTIARLPGLAADLGRLVDTDVPADKALGLTRLATKIKRGDVRFAILPGELGDPATGYFQPDRVKIRSLVEEIVLGIHKDSNSTVRVEVLNGSGVPGQGEKFARLLRQQGFSVVSVGTAARANYPSTEVIGRNGPATLDMVAAGVGRLLGTAMRSSAAAGSPGVDVTVIVGRDFR